MYNPTDEQVKRIAAILLEQATAEEDPGIDELLPKKELNPLLWQDGKLKKEFVLKLLHITDDFMKSLDYDLPLKDITVTGSLANYNWSDKSDIDLHIVTDFDDFPDPKLAKAYFDSKAHAYNKDSSIRLKGFDVEIYVQDDNEPHISTGVYSIAKGEWVTEPSSKREISVNRHKVKSKFNYFKYCFSRVGPVLICLVIKNLLQIIIQRNIAAFPCYRKVSALYDYLILQFVFCWGDASPLLFSNRKDS